MSLTVNPGETLEDFVARASSYYASTMAAAVAVVETAAEEVAVAEELAEVSHEQAAPDTAERFEQFSIGRPERIDREKGEMYGVRVMGMKSSHGYEYSLDAQRAVASRYEQMPVGLDHDYSGSPLKIAGAWGVLFNPRVDDRGTIADLKYLKTHERTEQILEDAERDTGIFSMSPVTSRVVEDRRTRVVTSFVPVRCDLVVRGATTRKLFEQAAAAIEPEGLKALRDEVASLKAELAATRAATTRHEQALAARTTLQETIAKATEGLDLQKFWRDK